MRDPERHVLACARLRWRGALVDATSPTLFPIRAGLTPDGQTLGTPIAVLVRNIDQRSNDYSEMSVRTRVWLHKH